MLLEKIYNTFKRKAATVVKNFRSDNFHHLKPKLLEATKPPPDDLLRNKFRNQNMNDMNDMNNELDDILEENSINDETVLIDKNPNIDETYDQEQGDPHVSELRQSDHDFEQDYIQQIDRNGLNVASREGMTREEAEARRKALLMGLNSNSSDSKSRISSAIPEDDQIAFQDPNLAMLNSEGSNMDENSEEQDMVYYLKEDQTQYSKPLGLNKAPKKKDPKPLTDDGLSGGPSLDGSRLLGDDLQRNAQSDLGGNSLFGEGLGGIDEGDESVNLIDGGKSKRKRKRKKPKPERLTTEQRNRLKKLGQLYGQNAEQLGLSPRDERYNNSKNKGKITKKKKSKSKNRKGGTKQEDRVIRFKGLNLNRPERSENGEYDKLRRKLQKFRKRKDLSFWVDYDSPYAEYLPHRFREWVPETKKGLNLDENPKQQNANYKAMELSRIYSRGNGGPEDGKEGIENAENKNSVHLSPNRAPSRSRPKSNISMNIEDVDELSSNRKSRGRTSSKKKKSVNNLPIAENSREIIDF